MTGEIIPFLGAVSRPIPIAPSDPYPEVRALFLELLYERLSVMSATEAAMELHKLRVEVEQAVALARTWR